MMILTYPENWVPSMLTGNNPSRGSPPIDVLVECCICCEEWYVPDSAVACDSASFVNCKARVTDLLPFVGIVNATRASFCQGLGPAGRVIGGTNGGR